MSGNPFKIMDQVDGTFEIEKIPTMIVGYDIEKLKWRNVAGYDVLTLNELLEQVIEERKKQPIIEDGVPFLRVHYESGLWGVIFEACRCSKTDKQWIVHGITKGYA